MKRTAVLALCLVFLAEPARADERPPVGRLVGAGLGMAVPTYFLGVVVHEGSHALAGLINGNEVTEYHVLPGFYGPRKDFHFGYVRVSGAMTRGERIFFLAAPKIADTILLSSYAFAEEFGGLPDNRYGQLALVVLATGFWVDFTKDITATRPANDMVKIYNSLGLKSEWQRLPLRALQLGLSVAGGYFIYRGYERVFDPDDPDADPGAMPVIAPLWTGVF